MNGSIAPLKMLKRLVVGAFLVLAVTFRPHTAAAQNTCGGTNHYRWKEKVEAPGSHSRADTVTINQLLDDWAHPEIGKGAADFCVRRDADEKKRIVVSGWLWRVKLSDDDDDYHLELTQSRTKFSERCVIAEIPDPEWGAGYGRVRAALDNILGDTVKSTLDLEKPIHVRITGVAFWDGWHAGAEHPNSHGRCNAPGIGVWEIHPVTRIARIK